MTGFLMQCVLQIFSLFPLLEEGAQRSDKNAFNMDASTKSIMPRDAITYFGQAKIALNSAVTCSDNKYNLGRAEILWHTLQPTHITCNLAIFR